MLSKKLKIRIQTLLTLVDFELYDFATGIFTKSRIQVCASGNQNHLRLGTAMLAREMAERGGRCLVVLSSIESTAAWYLRNVFSHYNLPQADWVYKHTQATPPPPAVVLTSQKTFRKALFKKGHLRLLFDVILFLNLEASLFTEDWFDSNLILIRLWEMGVLGRVPLYFLVEEYATGFVGWLETFEVEVTTLMDKTDPIEPEARRVPPENVLCATIRRH